MLQSILIGHLGADAEVKNANGREFIAFRIAHTDKWTDEAGTVHENTTWVDCIMNGKPNVYQWLKKGQCVFVQGSTNLRVYSSAKDRCMKAGLTINAIRVELIGGKGDDVPQLLFSEDGTQQFNVSKYYFSPVGDSPIAKGEKRVLLSKSGARYTQDENGWIYPDSAPE